MPSTTLATKQKIRPLAITRALVKRSSTYDERGTPAEQYETNISPYKGRK